METARSLVIWLPPTGITHEYHGLPWRYMTISVTPPPMSTRTTPISFSSAVRVVSADAIDPSTKLLTENLFASTALMVFVSADASPTTT